jgi:hypothetical protein
MVSSGGTKEHVYTNHNIHFRHILSFTNNSSIASDFLADVDKEFYVCMKDSELSLYGLNPNKKYYFLMSLKMELYRGCYSYQTCLQ